MPPEICESESFKEMHSQIEAFLDTIQTQASEDSSAMPPESTLEDHNDAAQIQDTSQSVDGTQQESSGSSVSDTKGVNHPSTEGVSGMPEAARREGRKEVIEQFEPGVYVTLILLADGTKIFKRVRFRYLT